MMLWMIWIMGASPLAMVEDIALLEQRIVEQTAPIGSDGGLVRALDRRLHLPKCPTDPEIQLTAVPMVQCPMLGWRIALSLRSAPITPVVMPGDSVEMHVTGTDFVLSSRWYALDRGAVGQIIRVRSGDRAGRINRARIIDAGQVAPLSP